MKKLIVPLVGFLLIGALACTKHAPLPMPVKVQGTAMLPALKDGDRIFIDRNYATLERGNIVVFHYPEDTRKSYIKRIVALPEEEIEIVEGKVFVNGKVLEEPYVDPRSNLASRNHGKAKVPPESYFVMGDNRDNSNDSRVFGSVPRGLIYGKFISKYYEAE